jgi:hypothetical protein
MKTIDELERERDDYAITQADAQILRMQQPPKTSQYASRPFESRV